MNKLTFRLFSFVVDEKIRVNSSELKFKELLLVLKCRQLWFDMLDRIFCFVTIIKNLDWRILLNECFFFFAFFRSNYWNVEKIFTQLSLNLFFLAREGDENIPAFTILFKKFDEINFSHRVKIWIIFCTG